MELLHSFAGSDDSLEIKNRLIANVKKAVKQLMEEAVTKKCVREESASVTNLCRAIEGCLNHGLRRRTLGLFKTSHTMALIQKIAKNCPEAEYIRFRLLEIEFANGTTNVNNQRTCASSDSIVRPKLFGKCNISTSNSVFTINSLPATTPPIVVKYLWIRIALYEKRLEKIVEYLVYNAVNYYDRDALIADPEYGSVLSALLVGPCALEFSQSSSIDYLCCDPSIDVLVFRHRVGAVGRTPSLTQRPWINYKRTLHNNSDNSSVYSFQAISSANLVKDYVESLHQNSRTVLLYGKNNVLVLPKELNEPLSGYLSLHQTTKSLFIKWTPNYLMNGYNHITDIKMDFWSYALNINVDELVYIHCHQIDTNDDTGGTIVLVGMDGVQQPPIHFPEGGHMKSFLTCLESGLQPHGQLQPPLWTQKGIGKIFSWPMNVKRHLLPSKLGGTATNLPTDYVFRIVSKNHREEFVNSIFEWGRFSPRREFLLSTSTTGSSDCCSNNSFSMEKVAAEKTPLMQTNQAASIELVCSQMRRQIICRAFYGWLAYCRHLTTVRTHLFGLVNMRVTLKLTDSNASLSKELWDTLRYSESNREAILCIVYCGGVEASIRHEVWPYLLGHYSFGLTRQECEEVDEMTKHYYETKMSEWLAVEAIVRQHEKEKTAKALAKISLEHKRNHDNIGNLEKLENDDHDLDISNITDTGIDIDIDDDIYLDMDNDYRDHLDKENINSSPAEDNNLTANLDSMKSSFESAEEGNQLHKSDYHFMIEIDPTITAGKSPEINCIETSSENLDSGVQETNCFTLPSDGVKTPKNEGMLLLSIKSSPSTSSYETVANEYMDIAEVTNPLNGFIQPEFISPQILMQEDQTKIHEPKITTNEGVNKINHPKSHMEEHNQVEVVEDASRKTSLLSTMNEDVTVIASIDNLQDNISLGASPDSSNGGIYSCELLENFSLNLHRIEKDVQRCDRNYWYFANENLEKLRNVITTYVWEHLDVGYMQGMCDLVAPLLVIFDDEALTYGCFNKLMERMIDNFPNGEAMDLHFANMRSLIQILDPELYDLMDANDDYSHFYFCYRWFLLDFKREFVYDDVFTTWEVIWSAKHVAANHFVLFIALALLETYRDIILSNNMDFADVIKFFNEMAEKHNAKSILKLARNLVFQLQTILENE